MCDGGRYKIRACDPIRVKDMLYPEPIAPASSKENTNTNLDDGAIHFLKSRFR